MFDSQQRDLQLTGITYRTLAVIVTYIYTRRADAGEIRSQAESIVRASNMMLLDDLVARCLHVLQETLDEANVIQTLCLADKLRFPALREACTSFMMEQMHPDEVRRAVQKHLREGGDSDVVTDLLVEVLAGAKRRKLDQTE